MSRPKIVKTKAKKTEEVVVVVVPPTQLQLDPIHVKTFLYLEQRHKNVELNRRVAGSDWEKAAREHSVKLNRLEAEENDIKKEYAELTKELSDKFGVDIKDYAYDDKTGILNYIEAKKPVT